MLETFTSFVMSYWYLQRSGLPFSAFWFKYGAIPDNVTEEYYNARLAEASSIYFVNIVVMCVLIIPYIQECSEVNADFLQAMVQSHVSPHPALEHLPASAGLQQADSELAAVPSDPVCFLYGYIMALRPAATESFGYLASASGAFFPPGGIWHGGPAAG